MVQLYDIFISFSTEDVNIARSLTERLIAGGLRVWFCEYELLESYYFKSAGCDLRLMSVDTTDGLVNEGRNLVIVALIDTTLHIRIFDANGKRVVDKAEDKLTSGERLTTLKKQLNPLPDESGLSPEQKQKIIQDAIDYLLCEKLKDGVFNSDRAIIMTNDRWVESQFCQHEMECIMQRISKDNIIQV